MSGLPSTFRTPIREVMSVDHDTQEVAGEEAILCRLDADDANDQAVYRCDDPAIP